MSTIIEFLVKRSAIKSLLKDLFALFLGTKGFLKLKTRDIDLEVHDFSSHTSLVILHFFLSLFQCLLFQCFVYSFSWRPLSDQNLIHIRWCLIHLFMRGVSRNRFYLCIHSLTQLNSLSFSFSFLLSVHWSHSPTHLINLWMRDVVLRHYLPHSHSLSWNDLFSCCRSTGMEYKGLYTSHSQTNWSTGMTKKDIITH